MLKKIIPALAAVLMAACGGSDPSAMDAQKALDGYYKMAGFVRVTDFKETAREKKKTGLAEMPQETLVIDYDAELEYIEDVYISPGGMLRKADGFPNDRELSKGAKGSRQHRTGKLSYIRTPKVSKTWSAFSFQ